MSARQFLRFLDSVQNYTKAIRQRQGILLSFAKVSDFSKLFGYIKTPLIRQGFSVLSNQFSFSYFCQRKKKQQCATTSILLAAEKETRVTPPAAESAVDAVNEISCPAKADHNPRQPARSDTNQRGRHK
jgi:hypothetical protein